MINWQSGFEEYEKVKSVLIKKYEMTIEEAEYMIKYLSLETFYKMYKQYEK